MTFCKKKGQVNWVTEAMFLTRRAQRAQRKKSIYSRRNELPAKAMTRGLLGELTGRAKTR